MGREPLTPQFGLYSEISVRVESLLPRVIGQASLSEALDVLGEMTRPDHTLVAYLCILANNFPEVVDENRNLVWKKEDFVMTPDVVVWEATSSLPSVQHLVRQMRLRYRESLDPIIASKPKRKHLVALAKIRLSLR